MESATYSPPTAQTGALIYKHKKPSHHLLIREIKRLRAENVSLRSSVTVLQSDLRNESQSRKATDETHKKIYDDMLDRNNQLELDLMDKDDEIEALKQKLDQLELMLIEQKHKDDDTKEEKLTLHLKRNSSNFGCFDIDEITNVGHHHHDDVLFCQPSGAHDSALPDLNNNQFLFRQDSDEENEEMEGEDGIQQQESYETEPFEELVPSYIHQALLSKLSSARVRLELDDLIVKYEASPDLIFRALAKSFIDWVGSILKQQPAEMSPSKLFMTKIQSGIAGFWQEILSYFAHDNDGQYNLLHDIEENIETDQDETMTSCWRKVVADHFDHLVLMLYKHHIVDDDAVVSWWNKPFNNTISKKIRNITHRFVEWIEDSEEEDDDSEEEQDDSDDDDNDHDDDEQQKQKQQKQQQDDQVKEKQQQQQQQQQEEEEEEEEEDYVDNFDEQEDFDELDIIMSPPHADDPSTSGDDTDNGYEHAVMLDNHSLHTMLNDLLIDNDYCICQFNNNAIRTTELGSFAPQDELHNKCLCDYNNNTPTIPVTEKKKKTVRIAM